MWRAFPSNIGAYRLAHSSFNPYARLFPVAP